MTHLSVEVICPNPKCPAKTSGENPRTKILKWGWYGKDKRRRLYCTRCKKAFSETAAMSRGSFYRRRKPNNRGEAIFLYLRGMSYRRIAKELGVNAKSVSKWIKDYGVSRKVGRYSADFQSTLAQGNQTHGPQESSIDPKPGFPISDTLENEFKELAERAIKADDRTMRKMIEEKSGDEGEE